MIPNPFNPVTLLLWWIGTSELFMDDITHDGQRYIIRAKPRRFSRGGWRIKVRKVADDPFGTPVHSFEGTGGKAAAQRAGERLRADIRAGKIEWAA